MLRYGSPDQKRIPWYEVPLAAAAHILVILVITASWMCHHQGYQAGLRDRADTSQHQPERCVPRQATEPEYAVPR